MDVVGGRGVVVICFGSRVRFCPQVARIVLSACAQGYLFIFIFLYYRVLVETWAGISMLSLWTKVYRPTCTASLCIFLMCLHNNLFSIVFVHFLFCFRINISNVFAYFCVVCIFLICLHISLVFAYFYFVCIFILFINISVVFAYFCCVCIVLLCLLLSIVLHISIVLVYF